MFYKCRVFALILRSKLLFHINAVKIIFTIHNTALNIEFQKTNVGTYCIFISIYNPLSINECPENTVN